VDSLGITTANGLALVPTHVPFQVRVINFSKEQRLLKKNMVLVFALPHPTIIITLPYNAGQYAAPEGKTDLAHTDAMADVSWREEVALGHLSDRDREKILGILSKHRAMWDGHSGTFTATSHRIELVPDARPVHCQPYRVGPNARQAETTEMAKMLRSGVIKPATGEWASPVAQNLDDESLPEVYGSEP
jgi:hypothetical protein